MARPAGALVQLLFSVLFMLLPLPVGAQVTGGTVVLRGKLTDNTYVAGGMVDVAAEVERDFVAAGGTINVRELVKGDVTVAGGAVNISARVGDDIRAAGGTVIVGAEVGGEVVAAGGTVTLAPDAKVAGRAWLSGGRVTAAGRIARDLKVAAGSVSLAGEVDGNVLIAARTIEILPTARIKGDLTYTSMSTARIDPGAQIQGKVTFRRSDLAERAARLGRVIFVIARVVLLAGLIVAGVVLLLLLPGFAISAAQTIRNHFWKSLGLGFLGFVVTPVVAILLMASIIGIPVGLAVGALYPVALLLGYLTAAISFGDWGARLIGRRSEISTAERTLWLVAALVILALVHLIPILGSIVVWLVVLIGLGAAGQEAFRRWSEVRS
jgi:cytoskeletal protein CcmA (bactofilin family)